MNNLPQSFSNQSGISFPIQFFHPQNVGLPMNSPLNSVQPLIFNPLSDWTNPSHLHSYLLGNLGRRIQHHPVIVPPPPPPPIPVRTPSQSDRVSISLVCASLLSKAFSEIKQKEKKESPSPRLSRSLPPIVLPCEGMEDDDDEMPYLLPFTPTQQLHIEIPPHPIQSISSNNLLVLATPSPDSSSLSTISANRLSNSSEGHESDVESGNSVIYVRTQKRIVEISSDEDQKDSNDDESDMEEEEDSDDDESLSLEASPSQNDVLLSRRNYEWRRPTALAASSQITMTLKREDENEKEEKRFKRVMKRTAASYAKKQARVMKKRKISKNSKVHHRIAERRDVEMTMTEREEMKKEKDEFEDSEEEDIDIMG